MFIIVWELSCLKRVLVQGCQRMVLALPLIYCKALGTFLCSFAALWLLFSIWARGIAQC